MPYLRGDLDRFSEEVYGFMKMGSVVRNMDIHSAESAAFGSLDKHDDSGAGEMEGVGTTSRPPSPPDMRAEKSGVTIMPCPVRLTPLVPPENYGAVECGTIFRSGFPQSANVNFLDSLRIRSILTLVEHPPKPEVATFIAMFGINHATVPVEKNKNGRNTTLDSLCEALLFIMNPANHPVYIHCNMGKHRTGCVVACLRKCQQWPIDEVLAEYNTYAADKARAADIELINAFDPASVYEYAKVHKYLDLWECEQRQDSAADIWELASSLPAHELSQIPKTDKEKRNDDFDAEDGLTMKRSVPDPTLLRNGLVLNEHDSAFTCQSNHGANHANVTVMEVEDAEDHVSTSDTNATAAPDIAEHHKESVVFSAVSTQPVIVPTFGPRLP